MEELTIEEQIKVLRKAKFYLIREFYVLHGKDTKKGTAGLCHLIRCGYLYYNNGVYLAFGAIEKVIPLFTLENARQHSKNRKYGTAYWWDRNNLEDRKKFLDWMIQELEKQL